MEAPSSPSPLAAAAGGLQDGNATSTSNMSVSGQNNGSRHADAGKATPDSAMNAATHEPVLPKPLGVAGGFVGASDGAAVTPLTVAAGAAAAAGGAGAHHASSPTSSTSSAVGSTAVGSSATVSGLTMGGLARSGAPSLSSSPAADARIALRDWRWVCTALASIAEATPVGLPLVDTVVIERGKPTVWLTLEPQDAFASGLLRGDTAADDEESRSRPPRAIVRARPCNTACATDVFNTFCALSAANSQNHRGNACVTHYAIGLPQVRSTNL